MNMVVTRKTLIMSCIYHVLHTCYWQDKNLTKAAAYSSISLRQSWNQFSHLIGKKNYEKIEIGNVYHFNFLQEIAGIGRENWNC